MRSKLLMFTVAIAAGASINLVHADDLTSRLTNPSFEDGVNGWTVDNPNGCTSEIRTAGVATDNNFGAVQTVPDGANFYYARKGWATTTSSIHQTITGLAAGTYKLSLSSLSLHVNATTDVASYTVSVKNAAGTVLDSKTITASDVASGAAATDGPINTMEWTATELAFGIDAVSDITVQVDFNYVPNGTSFLLDNFELNYTPAPSGNTYLLNQKKYKATGSNLIENAGFESGLAGWLAGDGSALSAGTKFSIVAEGGFSGAYLTGGNANAATGAGALAVTNATLDPLKTYVFSYYTKALLAANASTALTSFKVSTADAESVSTVQLASANVGADWTQNSVAFTGASSLSANFYYLNGKYAFDSFELAEVSEIANTDALQEVITAAEALSAAAAEGTAKDNLNTAIIAAKSHLEATSVLEVETAVTALKEAIKTFKYGDASTENPMDLTSLVTNANFETGLTNVGANNATSVNGGWTCEGTVTNFWKLSAGTRTGFEGSALETWSPGGSAISRKVYQVVRDLPIGVYSITAAIFANDQSKTNHLDGAYIYGNDATAKVNIGQDSDASAVYTVNNVLVTDGTLELGYKFVNAYANWSAIDNVKLSYLGSEAMTIAMAATLTSSIATAEAVSGGMLATAASDLASALATAKAALAADPQSYVTMKAADDALKAAIATAKASIAIYAPLGALITEAKNAGLQSATGYADLTAAITTADGIYKAGTATSEEITTAVTNLAAALKACRYTAPLPADYTFLVTNPSFEDGVTSWTGLTATHGFNSALAGYTGKFAESWVSGGSNLADKDIYQTLSDLPNGEYVISMYANAVQQGNLATEITGTTFYGNDQMIAINSANSDSKSENAKLYSLGVTVTDGTLKMGVKLESANCNWLSFDNFSLTYYGATVEATDIDMTSSIVNPTITTTTGNVKVAPTGWTESTNSGGNGAFTKAKSGDTFLEAWGGTASALNFNYKQRIANLLAGVYTLKAGTFAASTAGKAVLYAAAGATELQTPMTTGINGDTPSWQTAGVTTVANVTVAKGDTLTIGVKNITTLDGAWHGADSFSLTYTSGNVAYLEGQIAAANAIGQIQDSVATVLSLALGSAEKALTSTSIPVQLKAISVLKTAIIAAKTSAAEYADLANALVAADTMKVHWGELSGLGAYNTAIAVAKKVYEDGLVTTTDAAIAELQKASVAYRLTALYGDFSFMVPNGDMEQNASKVTPSWTVTNNIDKTGASVANGNWGALVTTAANKGAYFTSKALEVWSASGNSYTRSVSQVIEGLPNGAYEVSVAVFATDQAKAATNVGRMYFYAGNDTADIAFSAYTTDAATIATNAVYTISKINVTDGTLPVGLKQVASNANWFAFDNVKLIYLGSVEKALATLDEVVATTEGLLTSEETAPLIVKGESTAATAAVNAAKAIDRTSISEIDAATKSVKASLINVKAAIVLGAQMKPLLTEAQSAVALLPESPAAITLATVLATEQATYQADTTLNEDVTLSLSTLKAAVKTYYTAIASDATAVITNPGFSANAATGWTGATGAANNSEYEFYNQTFNFNQTITNLPNGTYLLKVQAFQRNGGNDAGAAYLAGTDSVTANLYATSGTATVSSKLMSIYAEGVTSYGTLNGYVNSMAEAANAFAAGLYADNQLVATVTDGTLKIGISCEKKNDAAWVLLDNFTLAYLGAAPTAELQTLVSQSEELAASAMAASVKTTLSAALTSAKAAVTSGEVVVAYKALADAKTVVEESITAFAEFVTVIAEAQALAEEHASSDAKTTFVAAITAAQDILVAETTKNSDVPAAVEALKAAILAFQQGTVGISNVGADGVKVYVDGSTIVVEGADYQLYNQAGVLINPDQQLVPGVYIVKVAGQTIKIAVK